MKFPVVDYSWCQSSIGHGMYEISSSGFIYGISPVLDIEYMKFPVVDYS
jgi:hypothetical protein